MRWGGTLMSDIVDSRYNIISILSDDQGAWALGCNGNNEIFTPNLDKLAAEGVMLRNFFCTSPVCSPARASLFTGRIPSAHGIHDWIREGNCGSEGKEYLGNLDSYVDYLSLAGYTCALSGKWHMGNSHKIHRGFSHWYAHQKGGGDYYGSPMIRDGKPVVETEYITDVITDDAIQFIENQQGTDNPFYLSVHYTAPHSPWIDQHPKRFVSLYDDCLFNSCPRLPPHPWMNFIAVPDAVPPSIWENPSEHLKGYYAAISAMDWNIGRIIESIESLGLRERTLICFISDNGFNCGHHGIWGKGNGTYPMNMYDTSVKVPAIFSHPGIILQDESSDALLSGYDFMPTLLDYVGIPYSAPDKPGKSFKQVLLAAAKENDDESAVCVFDEYGPVRMIRNKQYKYVHRYPSGPNELYHLINDPDEVENLIGNDSYSIIEASMAQQLENWFDLYVNPELDGKGAPVTGNGQIDYVNQGRKSFY